MTSLLQQYLSQKPWSHWCQLPLLHHLNPMCIMCLYVRVLRTRYLNNRGRAEGGICRVLGYLFALIYWALPITLSWEVCSVLANGSKTFPTVMYFYQRDGSLLSHSPIYPAWLPTCSHCSPSSPTRSRQLAFTQGSRLTTCLTLIQPVEVANSPTSLTISLTCSHWSSPD